MTWPWDRKARFERLAIRAREALELHQYAQVLPLAEKIIRLRHSFGFEAKARALAALGRTQEALAAMEEGVRVAPLVPPLWGYLGEYRSEVGDFAGAHEAFGRQASFPSPWREEAIVNDALVFLREERHDEGLVRLDDAGSPSEPRLRALKECVRLRTLVDLQRWSDAIQYGEKALGDLAGHTDAIEQDVSASQSLGEVRALVGEAHWRGGGDRKTAMEHCRAATCTWRHPRLLDLIREIDGLDATRAAPYRLMCEGRAWFEIHDSEARPDHEPRPEVHGFLVTYWVLADSPEDGLEFVRRIESADLGDRLVSLQVSESEKLDQSVGGFRGVFRARTGRTVVLDSAGDG